jgi:hypothetical protein
MASGNLLSQSILPPHDLRVSGVDQAREAAELDQEFLGLVQCVKRLQQAGQELGGRDGRRANLPESIDGPLPGRQPLHLVHSALVQHTFLVTVDQADDYPDRE